MAASSNKQNSANDQITGAFLDFSDGTEVSVGALYNNGSATVFTFDPIYTNTLTMTVGTVSSSTGSVGLAEIQVYGSGYAATATASASGAAASGLSSLQDIALIATPTCSSQAYSQECDSAIDDVVDGYPGDYTKEWASAGGETSFLPHRYMN